MLGYNVFYEVDNAKKPYKSTEFYLELGEALKRALELSVASNISTIKIDSFEVNNLKTRFIKSNGIVTYNPDDFIKHPSSDKSFNDYIQEHFEEDSKNYSPCDECEFNYIDQCRSCQFASPSINESLNYGDEG